MSAFRPQDILLQSFGQLSDRLRQLGSAMAESAQKALTSGALPAPGLAEEMILIQQSFVELRKQIADLAVSFGLEMDAAATETSSLPALKQLLEKAVRQGIENDNARMRAISVLDRVLALQHRDQNEFPALQSCQAKAHKLRRKLNDAEGTQWRTHAAELLEGRDAFSALLNIIEHPDAEAGEAIVWEDQVEKAFDRTLQFAASRGRIIESNNQPVHARETAPPEAPAPPPPQPPLQEVAEIEPPAPVITAKPAGEAESSVAAPPSDATGKTVAAEVVPPTQPDAMPPYLPQVIQYPVPATPAIDKPHAAETSSLPDNLVNQYAAPSEWGTDIREIRELEVEMAFILPPEPEESPVEVEQPLKLLYNFQREDTSQKIAAAILDRGNAFDAPGELRDLVWRLIYEDRLSLAYQLARAMEARFSNLRPNVSSDLICALALSRHVRYKDGKLAETLRVALTNADQCMAREETSGGRGWNLGLTFMLIAAAFRPMLIVPNTRTPHAMTPPLLPDGFPHLYEYYKAVLHFSVYHQVLDPMALKKSKDGATWQKELSDLQNEVRVWAELAPNLDMKYGQAQAVWRNWTGKGGIVQSLLQPIIQNDLHSLESVQRQISVFQDKKKLAARAYQTNLEILGNRAERIVGNALERMYQHVRAASRFALRWIDLQDSGPTQGGHRLSAQAAELRDEVRTHQDEALQELQAFNDGGYPPYVMCGLAACERAINNLKQMFAPETPLPIDEPDPQDVLNSELLRIPTIPLDEHWEPQATRTTALIQALVELAAQDLEGWRQAFDAGLDRGDHEAIQRILDYLARKGDAGINLAELRSR